MLVEKIEDVSLADEEIVVRERDFGDVKGSPLLRDFVKVGPDQPSLLHLVHCYSFVPSCGNGEWLCKQMTRQDGRWKVLPWQIGNCAALSGTGATVE